MWRGIPNFCCTSASGVASEATVKQYLTVQTERAREIQRKVDHYRLQAIIAVVLRIENEQH